MGTKSKSIKDPDTEVLIVDDNPHYCFLLNKMLSGVFGYKRVSVFSTVDQAFEAIRNEPNRFRLLFIDYQFPSGVSGGELLKMLSVHSLLKNKVAFLVTSDPTVDNVGEALAAGALAVIAKPFDREALRVQLEKAERILTVEDADSF